MNSRRTVGTHFCRTAISRTIQRRVRNVRGHGGILFHYANTDANAGIHTGSGAYVCGKGTRFLGGIHEAIPIIVNIGLVNIGRRCTIN